MATTAPATNGRATVRGADAPDPRDRPAVPGWLEGPTRAFWGALSAARAARVFHPHGKAYEATLTVSPRGRGEGHGVALLDVPGEHRAIARISRGAGLPEPLPDALGLAVRLVDVHGRGHHQDFLLITSANVPVLHHLILPAPFGIGSQPLSSVLPYRIGGRMGLVGALPRGRGAFDLAIAPVLGRFAPFGRLALGDELPAQVSEGLRFNPWHTGGGIQPAGPFQKIRDAAYRGSQAGRGAA